MTTNRWGAGTEDNDDVRDFVFGLNRLLMRRIKANIDRKELTGVGALLCYLRGGVDYEATSNPRGNDIVMWLPVSVRDAAVELLEQAHADNMKRVCTKSYWRNRNAAILKEITFLREYPHVCSRT